MMEMSFKLFMAMLIATWMCGAFTAAAIWIIVDNQEKIETELQ